MTTRLEIGAIRVRKLNKILLESSNEIMCLQYQEHVENQTNNSKLWQLEPYQY